MTIENIVSCYNKTGTIRAVAKELGLSEQKVVKSLITADQYEDEKSIEVARLLQGGLSITEISEKTHLSVKYLNKYLPYTKGAYNAEKPSVNALRIRKHRDNK